MEYNSDKSSRHSSNSSKTFIKPCDKVKSKESLALSLMPGFLKPKQITSKNQKKITPIKEKQASPEERSPHSYHGQTGSFSNYSNQKSIKCTLEYSSGALENYEDYIQSVRSAEPEDKKVLKISIFVLSKADFLTLIDPDPLSRNAIDSCLSVLKQINSNILVENESIYKVEISSTSFA